MKKKVTCYQIPVTGKTWNLEPGNRQLVTGMPITRTQKQLKRKLNYKATPLPFDALNFYTTASLFNKFPDKYQSQPAPRLVLRTAAAVFFLAQEQPFNHAGGHANAGINHPDHHLFFEVKSIHGNTAFFGKLVGIGKQVP